MEQIGPLTAEEIGHYRVNGWAYLPGFFDRTLAEELLDAAKSALGDRAEHEDRSGLVTDMWRDYQFPSRDLESFARVVSAAEFGRAARSLLARSVDVRFFNDQIAVKMPSDSGFSAKTPWHQDAPYKPFDRSGDMMFWIALEDMIPEQGTMSFLSGSHHDGSIGQTLDGGAGVDTVARALLDRPASVPRAMAAGDASVHHGHVVHSAGANLTDRPRWAYTVSFFPGCTGQRRPEHAPRRHRAAARGPVRPSSFPRGTDQRSRDEVVRGQRWVR